ncbi:MAG: CotH kinase family protein, partial [Thermodesulfobacteriota bacterium]|nr:CotH kinase family protein [Thermodesulfobacteriota bacterium]
DHTELLNFINNINTLSGDALKDYLDDKFEIDRFLRYQAMNVLLGKWDDYWAVGNNYYLYFSNDGKIEFLTFDYDMALGGGFALFDTASIGIYDWSNHVNELMAISSGFPLKFVDAVLNYNSPLVEKMFGIEEYRDKYEDYLKDFITPSNKLFIYSEYEKKYNFIHSLYSPYLANDTGEGEVMSNDESTREYFYKRTKSIIDELGLNEKEYETKPLSLDAPTGVSATDGTYPHMICVTWNTVPYSEYYRVYRSDFADGDYDQIGDNIRETGFDDESVTANSTYYYKVKAFIDEGVESEFSIHDVGSTNDGSITAPTWVTATDGFYSYMIAVSWDPVLNADYYKVYRSDSIDGTYGRISYNVEETSYNDRSIVANSIYYYRVKAFTNDGAETDFSIADKGSTSDTGLSTPEIIPGAPLISGFYSHSDDTGITTYTFEDDKTCTVSTPNPRDPKSGNLVTKGEWGYDDDDVLTIDTTGSIGGVITIDVTETWENAFTINNGYYLNFVNLKKKTGGQDCILGKYEGGGNVHVLVTAPSGSIITEEKISITAEVTINDDGTKETMYNISGDINTITETWSVEDNKLIEFDGYYYMPFSGENIIYTRQKAICPLSVALKSEEHINTLRNIRDFKPENRNWQNFVTMYYSNALEISTILLTNTVLKEKLKELVVKNIGIAEEYMESGSISLNENVIEDIITFLNKLKKAGSPKLKNDIEVVIEGINKNFLKGINVNVN